MKTNKTVHRAGVIGLGRIGYTLQFDRKREQPASHSAAFSSDKRFILAGGFDRDLNKMTAWSRSYPKAKIYDNPDEMLSDGKWDVLVIAVEEREHLPVIKKAAAAGPGLIVLEKPVAPSLKEALQIKKICSFYGVPVCVNHERRFSKDYRMAANLLSCGSFGNIVSVKASIFSPNNAWFRNDLSEGKGTLVHDGTHLVDAMRFLTGKNIRIVNAITAGKDKKGNIAGISAMGYAGERAVVTMDLGYRTGQFEFEIDLVCEKGRVRIGNGTFDVFQAKKSPYYEGFESLARDPAYSVKKNGKTGYFSGMVRNCADFLEGKSGLASTLDDGIEAMSVIEEIAKAAGLTPVPSPRVERGGRRSA